MKKETKTKIATTIIMSFLIALTVFLASFISAHANQAPESGTGTSDDPWVYYFEPRMSSDYDLFLYPFDEISSAFPLCETSSGYSCKIGNYRSYSYSMIYELENGETYKISGGNGGLRPETLFDLKYSILDVASNYSDKLSGSSCSWGSNCSLIRSAMQNGEKLKLHVKVKTAPIIQLYSTYDENAYIEFHYVFEVLPDSTIVSLIIDDSNDTEPELPNSLEIISPENNAVLVDTEAPTIQVKYSNDNHYSRIVYSTYYKNSETNDTEIHSKTVEITKETTQDIERSDTLETLGLTHGAYFTEVYMCDLDKGETLSTCDKKDEVYFMLGDEDVVDFYLDSLNEYDCDPSEYDLSVWQPSTFGPYLSCSIKHIIYNFIGYDPIKLKKYQYTMWQEAEILARKKIPSAWFFQIKNKWESAEKQEHLILGIDIPAMGNVEATKIIFADLGDLNFSEIELLAIEEVEKRYRIYIHLIIISGIIYWFVKRR